ncbi:MAG: ABC transporter permease [Microbacterium sp.]
MTSASPLTDAPVVDGGARRVIRHLRRDPVAVASTIVIAVFLLAAIFAGPITSLVGVDPYTYHQDLLTSKGVPVGFGGGMSAAHPFGLEPLTGRDLFAIVVHGARTSLFVGLSATVIATLIGTIVGLVTGFFGGWVDRIGSRFVDVMFGFPVLVFLIALMAIIPTSLPRPPFMVLVIGVFGWPGISRLVRGQVMSLRERTFVTASIAMGAPGWHVMFRQILPNALATIVVVTTIVIPAMIGTEAALSFLGVGVPPPTPSWGRTLGEAIGWVRTSPMYLIFPGAALFLITLAFNLFGDALRDALDPRTVTT